MADEQEAEDPKKPKTLEIAGKSMIEILAQVDLFSGLGPQILQLGRQGEVHGSGP